MTKYTPTKFKDYTSSFVNQTGQVDPAKRDELIINYTPLIKYIAGRVASRLPSHIAVDDLISSGIIGLIDAIDKFNPAKNVQFKTYAEFRIKGAILDELRSLDWVPRSVRRKSSDLENRYAELEKRLGRPARDEEIAHAMGMSMDEFHKLLDETKAISFLDIELLRQNTPEAEPSSLIESLCTNDSDPFNAISLEQIRKLLAQAVTELPEKEKLAVTLYYYEELTMKEIGLVMGYTESRISQMHSKAMLRLRTKIRKHFTPQ
ncbi:MAG: RNA polymerase subunit sigma [Deltaproteobacteria bacterium RIFOXYD12_FULL_50_9]|nr:MAG: RNA polymerase subunit sigma [Deltaproteobacteria bacterium RIFOXYD12_FULL_50_9]